MRTIFNLAERFAVLARDGFTCQYCGAKAPNAIVEVDHKIPVSRGGKTELSNAITACFECNMGKGSKTVEEAAAWGEFRRIERPIHTPSDPQYQRITMADFISKNKLTRKKLIADLDKGLILGASCLIRIREYRLIQTSKILTKEDFYK